MHLISLLWEATGNSSQESHFTFRFTCKLCDNKSESVHHLTGSSNALSLLSRLGHCAPWNTVPKKSQRILKKGTYNTAIQVWDKIDVWGETLTPEIYIRHVITMFIEINCHTFSPFLFHCCAMCWHCLNEEMPICHYHVY